MTRTIVESCSGPPRILVDPQDQPLQHEFSIREVARENEKEELEEGEKVVDWRGVVL